MLSTPGCWKYRQNVLERFHRLREVFWRIGRDDLQVGQAQLREDLAAPRGGRGEDDALAAEVVEDGEGEARIRDAATAEHDQIGADAYVDRHCIPVQREPVGYVA